MLPSCVGPAGPVTGLEPVEATVDAVDAVGVVAVVGVRDSVGGGDVVACVTVERDAAAARLVTARWCAVTACRARARVCACDTDRWRRLGARGCRAAAAFSASATAPERAASVDAVRPEDAALCDTRIWLGIRCETGPSLVPMTAATARTMTPSAGRLHRQAGRPRARSALRCGRWMARRGHSPTTGSTSPTGGACRSPTPGSGASRASCSAAESSLQNASAAGGMSCSGARCAARARAADPIGTSSSGGPSQSRGSRMTFSSSRGRPPLSSVRPSPVSTGFADLSSVRVPIRLRGEVQYNPELALFCLN
jgi:hypothetical protein